jgi:subtilisin
MAASRQGYGGSEAATAQEDGTDAFHLPARRNVMRARHHRLFGTAFAVLALLVATTAPVIGAERRGPVQVGTDVLARDSWIVTLVAAADPTVEAAGLSLAAGGTTGLVYRHVLSGFQFKGSAQAAAALARSPRVDSVVPDTAVYLTDSLPYGVERVAGWDPGGPNGAYQHGFRGNGARIAILDTGIDLDHPDLVANIDLASGHNCVDLALPPNDGYGHGTHVAGTAAAPYNGFGVIGVAPEAQLVPVKMFDDAGNSSQARALCALDHIVALDRDADPANDIDVANMSWGEQRAWGDCASDALHGAICNAHAAGIILVAGAGNSAVDAGNFVPAAYPEVISVSAWTDLNGEPGAGSGCAFIADIFWFECDETFALFSNHGPVDVMAPGVQIYSTWTGGGYRNSSGTSMATPHVAGIAALMAAAAPGLSTADALAAMVATGECPNDAFADADGVSGCNGQGTWTEDPDGIPEPLANALRATQYVAGNPPPPPPPPPPTPPAAPTLSGSASEGSVDLTWTAPTNDGGAPVTGYAIYRGTSTGTATPYATVGNVLTYADTSVTGGDTYWYEVAAVNTAGTGARSNEVSATPPAPPPPPDPPSEPALSASAGDASALLSWTAPADDGGATISGYEVYRGTAAGSATPHATVGNVLTFTDTGLANGTTYWYWVAAVNVAGIGDPSNEVSVTPSASATAPSAPTGLTAKVQGSSVRLAWSAPASNGGSALTFYRVQRSSSAGTATFQVPATQLVYIDPLPTEPRKTQYTYVVVAVNVIGQGPPSNSVTVRSR